MSKVWAMKSESKFVEKQQKTVFLNFWSGTRRLCDYKSVGGDIKNIYWTLLLYDYFRINVPCLFNLKSGTC